MSGVSCIGRMGGRKGDWFAELDFDASEASIMERTKEGTRGPVATVPMGAIFDTDDDHEAELVPNDEQNRVLCRIVFAPEAWRLLDHIRETLAARKPLEDGEPRYQHDIQDAELLREVTDCLACMDVPWTCRGCGGTTYRSGDDEQVFCDDCGRAADQEGE